MRALLTLALVALAQAANMTWTGAGTNNLWDNYANWAPPGIPTEADDCIVGKSGQKILIGTKNGAHCKSMSIADNITISLSGSSAIIGGGGLAIQGSSIFNVNAGAGSLTVAGLINFQDTTVLNWQSGSISGNVLVNPKVVVNIDSAGAALQCEAGKWQNNGVIKVVGSSQLNMSCPIENQGTITVDSQGSTATIWQFFLTSNSTGTTTASGTLQLKDAMANNVTIKGNLNIAPGGAITLNNIALNSGSQLAAIEPTNVKLNTLTCAGSTIALQGAGCQLDVTGPTTIGTLRSMTGHAHFYDTVTFDRIDGTGGVLRLDKNTSVTTATMKEDFSLQGAGPLTISGSVVFGNNMLLNCPTIVKTKATIAANQVTLDGTLTISAGAVLTVQDTDGNWGVSTSSKPGVLVNLGEVTFLASVTMNGVGYSGSGNFWVKDNTVDMQSMTVKVGSVGLNSTTANIKGESLLLDYDTMYGPSEGATIGIIDGADYTTCKSPCAAKHPAQSSQTYWAKVVP